MFPLLVAVGCVFFFFGRGWLRTLKLMDWAWKDVT